MKLPGVKIVFCLCILLSGALEANISDLTWGKEVGAGRLQKFGFTIYEASLFSRNGSFYPDKTYALKIVYHFNFTAEQLAQRSLKEIEGIHGKQVNPEEILSQLTSVFCDVEKGQDIVGIHFPGEGAEFFSRGEMLGKLDDSELAKAFFDIWLDENTSEPKLRNQLLGVSR